VSVKRDDTTRGRSVHAVLGHCCNEDVAQAQFLTRDIFRRKNPACKLPLGGKETLEDAPYTR
jgi:hypothetical protein